MSNEFLKMRFESDLGAGAVMLLVSPRLEIAGYEV